ncbi:MAG TPA: replication-associated recombination protein A, partial [Vicinamibacteria bacterium]|nr:replication-associated recombination protein A [Vicinamibacteria bacterium]
SEDVGLADPQALVVAMAAQQAVHFIGLPEGALALAELVVYLAAAPKSNAVYTAYAQAAHDALETRAEPVPLWIRNAPTGLMKDLGYGRGYQYAHDQKEGVAGMDCLPESLAGRRYYNPTDRGGEKELQARLEAARLVRERKKRPPTSG